MDWKSLNAERYKHNTWIMIANYKAIKAGFNQLKLNPTSFGKIMPSKSVNLKRLNASGKSHSTNASFLSFFLKKPNLQLFSQNNEKKKWKKS